MLFCTIYIKDDMIVDEQEILPVDPYILLSWANTMLRDKADGLDDLGATYGFDKERLISRLKSIGYRYDSSKKQFVVL